MRKAILPAVGIAAMAVTLVGCGSSGTSTAAGSTSPLLGNSSQQSAADNSGASTGSSGGSSTAETSSAGPCQPQYVVSFCEKIAITGAVTVNGTGSAIPEFDQDGAVK